MPKQKDYKYRHKKRGVLKKLSLFFLVFFCAISIFGAVFFFSLIKNLPDPLAIVQRKISESTKIYDRTGTVILYEIHGEEKRTVILFSSISQYVKDATIVSEDFDFYTHSGIDFKSIARALFIDLTRGRVVQGGSTITQQLVKNVFLTSEKTLLRKMKEALLSLELEKKYTKEEIFGFYLNQIPYGSNAYGIEAAARTFFGKNASKLTLAESALLAALPKAPSYYSPYGQNGGELFKRKDRILEKMSAIGFITQEESEKAKKEQLVFARQRESIKAPHFVMMIKTYLEERYGPDMVENGGLRVYTTLDYELQKAAEESVKKIGVENEKKYKAKNAAIVAVDPKTGQLLSLVGSRDYFDVERDGNFNVITSKNRQPGSLFKPFAYSVFFQKGYPPDTVFFDAETEFSTNPSESYAPGNYDGTFRGPVSAKSALAQSLNIPSVKVLYLAGIDDVVALAHAMGITTLKDKSRIGLSLVLGGGEVSPYDMVYAYSVFANDGVRNEKSFIMKIEDQKGNVLEKWELKQKRVLPANIARVISDILSNNTLRAPVFGEKSHLYFNNRQVAAKTGTTQKYRDAWVVGYTPSISTAVWVGNNDGTPMEKGGAGIAAAGPLFHAFMEKSFELNNEVEGFTTPNPITSEKPILNGNYINERVVFIDKDSGKLSTDKTPPSKVVEKSFKEIHTILHYVDKNDPLGYAPQNPHNDPQYLLWEEGLQSWLKKNTKFAIPEELAPTQYDDIHTEENTPRIYATSIAVSIDGDEVKIKTDVQSKFKIKEVNFFINNVLTPSIVSSPGEYTLLTHSLNKGMYFVSINIYDIYDNMGITEIVFTK